MILDPIHVIDFEGSRQSGVVEYGVVTTMVQGEIVDSLDAGMRDGDDLDRDRRAARH